MKNILLTALLFLGLSTSGFSQFHFGAGGQYVLDGSYLGIQGKAFYEHDETWRGSGTFTLHLESTVNWTIDLDGHYLLLEFGDDYNLAPVVGLAFTNFGFAGFNETDIGINLGAFMDLNFKDKHVYIEPKLVIGGVKSLVFSGGVFF